MKETTKEALIRYRDYGLPTGSFLFRVLVNDLLGAFMEADEQNAIDMREICLFVYNEMPSGCHGTTKRVMDWIDHKGLQKLTEEKICTL